MGIFDKLSGKPSKVDIESSGDGRNTENELELKEHFGLIYNNEGWVFEGGQVINDLVSQFRESDLVFNALKKLKKNIPFNKVCIVAANNMILLILDVQPKPTCIRSGLDAKGIANILTTAQKQGAKISVYNGTWLFTI